MAKYSNWQIISFDSNLTYFGQDFKYIDHSDIGLYQLYIYSLTKDRNEIIDKFSDLLRQSNQNDLTLEIYFVGGLRNFVDYMVRKQIKHKLLPVTSTPSQQEIDEWKSGFVSSSTVTPTKLSIRQKYDLAEIKDFVDYENLDETEWIFLNVVNEENKMLPDKEYSIFTENNILTQIQLSDSKDALNVGDIQMSTKHLLRLSQLRYLTLYSNPPRIKFNGFDKKY